MKNFDVIGKSKIWLSISAVLLLGSLICIAVFGLNPGIDFTGGSLMDITFTDSVEIDSVRTVFSDSGLTPTIQKTGDNSYMIRLGSFSNDQHTQILESIEQTLGSFEENRYETIGSVIGSELKQTSVKAIIILLVLIVLYVAWAFRKVSEPIKSWKYGLLTIVAAVHDVLIPLGVFAVLGHYYGYEMNTAFIAALLTIMGYSINDTIVIFDRTRENLVGNRYSSRSFKDIVNISVVQSFSRSINTSFTTVLVLVAILIFGGETTRPFVLALIVGIIAGTYSSIFVASPLLVYWEQWKRDREGE